MENTNKSIAKLNEWKRTSIFYNVFFLLDLIFYILRIKPPNSLHL
jgi:hypothetical protein